MVGREMLNDCSAFQFQGWSLKKHLAVAKRQMFESKDVF
jgi:hypothetical protein